MDKPQAQTSYSHLHSHVLYKSSGHCCCDLAINQSIWNKTCVVQLWWAWMNYILCFLFLANGTGTQCSLLLQQPICWRFNTFCIKKPLLVIKSGVFVVPVLFWQQQPRHHPQTSPSDTNKHAKVTKNHLSSPHWYTLDHVDMVKSAAAIRLADLWAVEQVYLTNLTVNVYEQCYISHQQIFSLYVASSFLVLFQVSNIVLTHSWSQHLPTLKCF